MYGNEIYPLGETGYGISVCFPSSGNQRWPEFAIFHSSDNFQQCLFFVDITDFIKPQICNYFPERIKRIAEMKPHG